MGAGGIQAVPLSAPVRAQQLRPGAHRVGLGGRIRVSGGAARRLRVRRPAARRAVDRLRRHGLPQLRGHAGARRVPRAGDLQHRRRQPRDAHVLRGLRRPDAHRPLHAAGAAEQSRRRDAADGLSTGKPAALRGGQLPVPVEHARARALPAHRTALGAGGAVPQRAAPDRLVRAAPRRRRPAAQCAAAKHAGLDGQRPARGQLHHQCALRGRAGGRGLAGRSGGRAARRRALAAHRRGRARDAAAQVLGRGSRAVLGQRPGDRAGRGLQRYLQCLRHPLRHRAARAPRCGGARDRGAIRRPGAGHAAVLRLRGRRDPGRRA